MYKIASNRHQTALHRGRPADWVNGKEQLKPADKLNQLRDGVKILQARIDAATGDEKKTLGLEKQTLQNEISALRKTLGRPPLNWHSFFINEAKRILSDSQFDLIYKASIRECEMAQKRRDEAGIATAHPRCERGP